jgi:gamma-glutamyltranspeptidase / glutathione hydrolase / leukotriene-C4 hydrolase
MSESTGIIFNDEMDDFAKPDSTGLIIYSSNFIQPAKCPLSSMTPIILLNENNDVSLVVGAAGEFHDFIAHSQCES